MKKSLSTPNLFTYPYIYPIGLRRSISHQALAKHFSAPQVTLVDAVILTKAPIHQAVSCIVSNEFPDDIISGKNVNKDLVACLASPCDPPPSEPPFTLIRPPPIVFEDEESKERYIAWLKRIRRQQRIV
jgi:hypothetical protein